jgi:Short-chain dehydrogenases of various substrate specificities
LRHTLRDKVIIITGASSGIGLATAKRFAQYGSKLVLAARSIDKLEAIMAEMPNPNDVLCVKTDVSVEVDCANMVSKAVEKFGRIDVLINNAGISMRALFSDVDLSVMKRLMDVNYWGTVYCTKFALPFLLKSKGSVVGVISIAGFNGLPARAGYTSSKYAIRGFLDSLRIEHLFDGLHVMVFSPGFTASNIRNVALLADGSPQGCTPRDESRMMTAEHVAKYLERGLVRRKASVILTPIGKMYVKLNQFFPRWSDKIGYYYMAKEPNSPFK